MPRIPSIVASTCLIGTGAIAWAFAGRPLVSNRNLNVPLNPLGINGSPYGEVFAMAMQGPIDTSFHGVMKSSGVHRHQDAETCETCSKSGNNSVPPHTNFQNLLTTLERATELRTNPKSSSEAFRLYMRRQVEDKLRFAYQLDPSHYANYNSLHLFLTEPQLGTRPELTASAAKLAEDTIRYCLAKNDDPRPALTAAAAASNILELMFNDRQNAAPKFTTEQMRQYLAVLDHCINRYVDLAKQWDESNNWSLLSPQRVNECDERYNFICKFREAASGAIDRFEGRPHAPQAAN